MRRKPSSMTIETYSHTLTRLLLTLLLVLAISNGGRARASAQADYSPPSPEVFLSRLNYYYNENSNNDYQQPLDGSLRPRADLSELLATGLRLLAELGLADVEMGSRQASDEEAAEASYRRRLMALHWWLSKLNAGNSNRPGAREGLTGAGAEDQLDPDMQSVVEQQVDVNSHLPARDPEGSGSISGPVNDPAEFEAAMGQLTDQLNHELPNSQNRSRMLDELMAAFYSGAIDDVPISEMTGRKLRQLSKLLRHQQTVETETEPEPDAENGELATDASAEPSTTFASLSRYGGSEYIDHPLALAGHQYVQGGAGEGRQLLGPEGTFENVQVVKSDHAVPSYCDPPNPCPIGYSARDGCLESFVNSASFSREYQAKQQCSCDNEHSLFNCAAPAAGLKGQLVEAETKPASELEGHQDAGAGQSADVAGSAVSASKLDTLARTIANRFGDLPIVRNLIARHQRQDQQDLHLVRAARKWHPEVFD